MPALPAELLTILENRDITGVLDIGGDPVGARVLARFNDKIITEDYQLIYVLNAKGELIGLAFDGNIESLSGDLKFNPTLQRCINVDVRYVLFVLDKFGGSTYLFDELEIR